MSKRETRIEAFLSPPFEQWAYLLWKSDRTGAIVVDPGFRTDPILEFLKRENLELVGILNTHGHSDHIAGNQAMLQAFPEAPLLIGRNEAHLLTDPSANLSAQFGLPFTSPPADRLLDDGEQFEIADVCFGVREIPGHSPGSVVFVLHGEDPLVVIGGDVLFAGSIGRTDFPGGSSKQLIEGIQTKLFDLPDETIIYPGHGPTTTIGVERQENPFVGSRSTGY